MNCKEFNQLFAELDSQSAPPPALQEHRELCAACRAMVEDFALIARQAHVLRPMEAPSERVWRNIHARLAAEGVIHSDGAPDRFPAGRVPTISGAALFTRRRVPMGLAYAAMFLVAAGVMYLQSLFTGSSVPPVLVARPMLPAIPLRDAVTTASDPNPGVVLAQQARAQMAASDLIAMAESVPEEHRATFVSSWNQETESIQQLMDVVQQFPDDPFVQMQLRNAMIRQRMLQETPSRWNQ